MTKTEKKVSTSGGSTFTIPKRRTGEKVAGAVTPIYFHQTKVQVEGDESTQKVEIPVKIDPSGSSKACNTTKEKFNRLNTFADAVQNVIDLRRDLDIKLYKPLGLTGPENFMYRLRYQAMLLGTTTRQQLSKAAEEAFLKVCEAQDATITVAERAE